MTKKLVFKYFSKYPNSPIYEGSGQINQLPKKIKGKSNVSTVVWERAFLAQKWSKTSIYFWYRGTCKRWGLRLYYANIWCILLQSKQPLFMSVTMTSSCSTKLKSNSSGIHNFHLALLSLLSNPKLPIWKIFSRGGYSSAQLDHYP